MNDNHKTKAQLIKELEALRQQAAHWEEAESKSQYAEEPLRRVKNDIGHYLKTVL